MSQCALKVCQGKKKWLTLLSRFSHMQKAARDKKLRTFYAKVLYKKEQEIKSVVCNSSHTCGNIYPFRNKNRKEIRAFFLRDRCLVINSNVVSCCTAVVPMRHTGMGCLTRLTHGK
jgi:hypothetical protein